MIHIEYGFDRDTHRLHITGHAGYAPRGQDIVCAGASAVACALMEYLRELNAAEEAYCRPGELKLRCGRRVETDIAFDMALAGWRRIAGTYPRYAEVNISPSEKGAEKEYTEYVQEQHHKNCL